MKFKVFALLIWGVMVGLCPRAARAEAPAALSLDDCVQWALTESMPVVRARIEQWIAQERISEVNGIYDAVLSARGDYEDASLPTGRNPFTGSSRSLMVESEVSRVLSGGTALAVGADFNRFRYPAAAQGFPFPAETSTSILRVSVTQPLWQNAWGALYRAEREAVSGLSSAAEYRYDDARQAVAGMVHVLFWDAYAADRSYRANARALDWSRQLLEISRSRWRDNLVDETDVLAAEAALAAREVDVLARRSTVAHTREGLLELIGWPREWWDETRLLFPDAVSDPIATDVPSPEEALSVALETRPDLYALDGQIRAAEWDQKAARQAARPALSVGASYGVGDSGDTQADAWGVGETVWSVGVQFSVPLQRRAERSRWLQAQWRRELLAQERADRVRVVDREVRSAVRSLDTAAAQVVATRRAQGLHERKWRLEEEKLQQGRSAMELVIRYQEDLELAEYATIAAWAEYEIARATLALAQGILVPSPEDRP